VNGNEEPAPGEWGDEVEELETRSMLKKSSKEDGKVKGGGWDWSTSIVVCCGGGARMEWLA